MSEEKQGSGLLGGVAAVAVGAGSGYAMTKRQTSNLIAETLENQAEIIAKGGKPAEFAKTLGEVAGKDGLGTKLTEAVKNIGLKGEEALKGEALSAANNAKTEALKGIKEGMAKADKAVWKNLPWGKVGKVAIVAIPATIATKVVADKVFGGKSHTAKLDAERAQAPAQAAGRA